jgi:hypothetical protein
MSWLRWRGCGKLFKNFLRSIAMAYGVRQTRNDVANGEPMRERMVFPTASTTLKVGQNYVQIAGDASLTITLPPVLEAMGEIVFIRTVTSGGKTITVQDQDDTVDDYSQDIEDTGDYVLLFSTGDRWIELAAVSGD